MSTPGIDWFAAQRWFAGKGRDAAVGGESRTTVDGTLAVSIVEIGHDHYQLVSTGGGPDTVSEPTTAAALARAFTAHTAAAGPAGTITFHHVGPGAVPGTPVRSLGLEQSNSSVVLGDRLVLKVLRRLQSGTHPEVEMLRRLTELGCPSIPALAGWYDAAGGPVDATLGVLQELVVGGEDGWTFVLDGLARSPGNLLPHLHRLGATLADVHRLLGAPTDDPAFAPAFAGRDRAQAVAEAITTAAARVMPRLAGHPDADDLTSRLPDVEACAHHLADRLDAGPAIRHHGDLHLGQTLLVGERWVLLDWEGEPARTLAERRAKAPALRDLAGLVRSFSYAAATHARADTGRPAPPGWEAAARSSLLDGYLQVADAAVLPEGPVAVSRLLGLLELEKVVYELGYELSHRPDWLAIPAAGLRTLLDRRAR